MPTPTWFQQIEHMATVAAAAADKLVTLAASAATRIEAMEASDPLVAQAVKMAESQLIANGVPGSWITDIAPLVLHMAQVFVDGTAKVALNGTPAAGAA